MLTSIFVNFAPYVHNRYIRFWPDTNPMAAIRIRNSHLEMAREGFPCSNAPLLARQMLGDLRSGRFSLPY